jgi:hypothetical protein
MRSGSDPGLSDKAGHGEDRTGPYMPTRTPG